MTTSDASFAVNGARDEVVVRCLRRLSALDYEEFEDILATVGEVADRSELMAERRAAPSDFDIWIETRFYTDRRGHRGG